MQNKYRSNFNSTKVRSSDTYEYIRTTGTAGTPTAVGMLATAERQQQQAHQQQQADRNSKGVKKNMKPETA
jgi:hypothetical protein